MTSPSTHITWSLAEAEAAHAAFYEIGPANFWVGVCKAVEVSVSNFGIHGRISAADNDFVTVTDKFLGGKEAGPNAAY